MRTYSTEGHTADIRLLVEASTMPELMQAALEGMASLIRHATCRASIELPFREKIALNSVDPTTLLIDFLSEVLTRSHAGGLIFCEVEFEYLSETALAGTIAGMPTDAWDEDIKAVTYHEAEIVQNAKGHFATAIIFDI